MSVFLDEGSFIEPGQQTELGTMLLRSASRVLIKITAESSWTIGSFSVVGDKQYS